MAPWRSILDELNDQFRDIMTTNHEIAQIAYRENRLRHFRPTHPDDAGKSIHELKLSKETEAELAYYSIKYIGELDIVANTHEKLLDTKQNALDLTPQVQCKAFDKEYEIIDQEDAGPQVRTNEGYICFYELIQENAAIAEENSHRRLVYNVFCRGHLLKLWMCDKEGNEVIIKTQFYHNPHADQILNTVGHTILALTSEAYKEIDNQLALREETIHKTSNEL